MSAEAVIDEALTRLLGKAVREQLSTIQPGASAAIVLNFDGAGQPLTVGMGGIPQMPYGAFKIIGCHMAAGIWNPTDLRLVPVNVSASVDIRLSSVLNWAGAGQSLYGTTRPSMSGTAETQNDISGWITELQPGDQLAYALSTFSGAATVLTLTLTLRRNDVLGLDAPTVTDEDGEAFTDANGQAFVIRS